MSRRTCRSEEASRAAIQYLLRRRPGFQNLKRRHARPSARPKLAIVGREVKNLLAVFCLALAMPLSTATAQQVQIGSEPVTETVAKLRPGEFVWAPEIAPSGPTILIVNLKTQRAVLFRNGLPIAASTVSTGKPGYRTPTGVFTILQKRVEHYSSTYDNAPMPYMQRLTWRGIALHAGKLPGYPASHGCVRLPLGFAKLLYGVTGLGMTVVVTDRPSVPRVAPTPRFADVGSKPPFGQVPFEWDPKRSEKGPVSIIVSAKDQRAVVIRNGVVIGSAYVNVEGPVQGTWAYALRSIDASGQKWVRLDLADTPEGQEVPRGEWSRFRATDQFKKAIASIVRPGTTIVVTGDSMVAGASGEAVTVLEDDGDGRP